METLEEVVIGRLFEVFGNPVAVQRAIEAATPNTEKMEEARSRLDNLAKELKQVKDGRGRILRLVSKGTTLSEEEADQELSQLRERENRLKEESNRLVATLDNSPTPEAIKAKARQVCEAFKKHIGTKKKKHTETEPDYTDTKQCLMFWKINASLDSMTWEEKKALAQQVFAGKLTDGRRRGIYLKRDEADQYRGQKTWKYTILGHLIETEGDLEFSHQHPEEFGLGSAAQYWRFQEVTSCASR